MNIQSSKIAKESTIFFIDNGSVESGNLYDFVRESANEVTSPRGVMTEYFVEEFEILEDGMYQKVEWP